MKKKNNLEQGQITLLFLFAVVALFGFAALSIDGGRLYFERRAAQGTADDAAMTGVLAIANAYNSSDVETIVLNRTKANGFDNAEDSVTVEVYWPPQAPNPYAGNMNYIQVFITSNIPMYFAQFVFQGDLQVTVEAVARYHPPTGIVSGYAMYGGNPSACRTVEFSGNPLVELTGGGDIGSNSDAECPCGSLVTGGDHVVDVLDGGIITAAGCWNNNGAPGGLNPTPLTGVDQIEMDKIINSMPIPDCSGLTDDFGKRIFNGPGTMSPGYYKSLKFLAAADVTLQPGLYCIYGKDPFSVEMLGGSMVGHGVTIFMMSTTGGWKSAGGAHITLTAPTTDLLDPSGNNWKGMLIYAHPDNTNPFTFAGGSNSYLEGTIYAPGSLCKVVGNSGGIGYTTSIICDMIEVTGTGDLEIFYDPDKNYEVPPKLDMSK